MAKRIGAAVSLFVPLMFLGSAAEAQSFNQFIGFGDSTIDSGWFLTHQISTNAAVESLYQASAAVGGGIPTTPGGPMNSQVLAGLFGLTAIPYGEPGGSNVAASGATNVSYPNDSTLAPTTVSQIQGYLALSNGAANPNALYVISSGGNDLSKAICPGGVCAPINGVSPQQLTINSANALAGAIAQLSSAGARYIVVPVDLGDKTPQDPAANPGSPEGQLKTLYAETLYANLQAAGINFIPASGKVVADAVGYDPGLFGITNVDAGSTTTHQGGACVNPNPALIPNSWALECTTLVAPNAQQTYLFADDEHYTTAGQLIEADYIYSLIVAPEEMSYLAEVPVKTRTAVVASIEQQIMISGRNRAVGTFNSWITGDISSLSMSTGYNGFPSDPGTPGMVTVGADYLLAPNWLVGGAVSAGTTTQSFSLGGNFRQNEYALSGYAAYVGHPLWFDMIASYGGLHYDTNRVVPIGITTVSNTGSTNGQNASFAAEVGYNFAAGGGWAPSPMSSPMSTKAASPVPAAFNLTYGPVAGIVVQHIDVNGFAESDPFGGDASGGFTALTYAGQVRNSAVTELGLQAGVDVGLWHPYGKLVWDHELNSDNRVVTAFEPEIAFAPGYSMPAVSFGRDWGSATAGTTYYLGHGMTAYASFNSEFGQSEVTYYGGQIGLNVALGAPPASIVTKE
jgi:outer membrane lipase/esterase